MEGKGMKNFSFHQKNTETIRGANEQRIDKCTAPAWGKSTRAFPD